jgi:pyridoxine 5-phosphate synthase
MTKLSVNVNKVATLRNTRTLGIPSVVRAATLCLEAGAHGITIHPRPDQRHIRPHDVDDLAQLLKRYPQAEFNIEGNPFHGYMDHIRRVRPTQCTLVPDEVNAFTSNHGWNLRDKQNVERLRPLIAEMKSLGCRVSLFMDPEVEQIPLAKELGADRVELYTEPYASAFAAGNQQGVESYAAAAKAAKQAGLGVNAGHDLSLVNLPFFLQQVPNVLEVSIGHALIADALEMGLPATVKAYLRACGDQA